ncbi:hypothetical protein [Ideonella sp. B508-1]|uniref:hypothetical protein n=1 Tax=Ideonella sp. B508-1 TaxID=137716 RepID=UPI000344CA4F|nr:hypothetical protein [Ideonella sp. B508-1]
MSAETQLQAAALLYFTPQQEAANGGALALPESSPAELQTQRKEVVKRIKLRTKELTDAQAIALSAGQRVQETLAKIRSSEAEIEEGKAAVASGTKTLRDLALTKAELELAREVLPQMRAHASAADSAARDAGLLLGSAQRELEQIDQQQTLHEIADALDASPAADAIRRLLSKAGAPEGVFVSLRQQA